jgi:hypothetical protein
MRNSNCIADRGEKRALFFSSVQTEFEAMQPSVQCVRWAVPAGVERLRNEANRSVQSSAEVRNGWSYSPFRHTP